jgi:hypothetical protein
MAKKSINSLDIPCFVGILLKFVIPTIQKKRENGGPP